MRKTMLLAAMLALTVLAMGAPAALADDNDRHHNFFDERNNSNVFDDFDDDDDFFVFDDVDVDIEEVGDNNDLEGECVVTDVDDDGFVDEWEAEVTCFV